jgi:Zn-dependent protease
MLPSKSGSIRLFRTSGIEVFVHWSWFVAAWYILSTRSHVYSSLAWSIAEYLGLFFIVLLHEFGHVLACRQVGGAANEITLWPLGGVAMVRPPPRPAAELWTIAAGPLVNAILWPVLMLATTAYAESSMSIATPDGERLLFRWWEINRLLLIFNLLPVFPLDGGQILRALLWFQIGRARSLQVASVIGFVAIVGLGLWRLSESPGDWMWTGIFALFLGSQCLAGYRRSVAMLAIEKLPRHADFACPSCHRSPPGGPLWQCQKCGNGFDVFSTRGVCPHCQTAVQSIPCVHCGAESPVANWKKSPRAESERPGDKPYVDI